MKKHIFYSILLFVFVSKLTAQTAVKTAFLEGIKASMKVVEYEKAQAHQPIPTGYCAAITGKIEPLALWEQVKLESLALFFEFNPSLFAFTSDSGESQNVLCLRIAEDKAQILEDLQTLRTKYPKLDTYLTKVEVLPKKGIYRVIPGVGYEPPAPSIAFAKAEKDAEAIVEETILYETASVQVIASEVSDVAFVKRTTAVERY